MQNDDLVEVVDELNIIVKMQSDVISELFRLLSQHITTEELDNLTVVDKINDIVSMDNYPRY